MMRRLRYVTGFVLATVLALSSLAGCGGGDKGPAPNADQTPTVAPPPPPPPPPDTEEAPIRVKNGSIDLELLSKDAEWESPSTGEWHQKDRARSKNDLDITIAHSGGTCTSQTATDNKVRFVYNDPETVTIELKGAGNKTKVTSDPRNLLARDTAQRLKYAGPVDKDADRYFIEYIFVGNGTKPLCTFTAKSQLSHALILDLK